MLIWNLVRGDHQAVKFTDIKDDVWSLNLLHVTVDQLTFLLLVFGVEDFLLSFTETLGDNLLGRHRCNSSKIVVLLELDFNNIADFGAFFDLLGFIDC